MAPDNVNPEMRTRHPGRLDSRRRAVRRLSPAILLTAVLIASIAWADPQPVDLAQAPMFSKITTPPANIMILLDDSGSMTWEILVKGQTGGLFPKAPPSSDGYAFVFDDPGDGLNVSRAEYDYLGAEGRKYWKSQHYQDNLLYYNPNVVYEPWTGYGSVSFKDANPKKPRVHPVRYPGNKLDLDDISFTVDKITVPDLPGDQYSIPHAHYFVYSTAEDAPYLVVLDGGSKQISYFQVTLDGSTGFHEKVTGLTEETMPPGDVVTGRTYDEERQTFAHWFTYGRRREDVATAALGRVLQTIEGVRVGIYGINQKVVQPLKKVKIVNSSNLLEDQVDELLEDLYDYVSRGGTPLNRGLNTIGRYFEKNDGKLGLKSGPEPYGTEDEGGTCQQSFTIIMTDGYYTDPGDVNIGGNLDENDDDGQPYKDWGGGEHPYADAVENSLADIAFYYYANDLIPPLDDKVPTSGRDGAPHQHMTTFGVAFGVSGTLDPEEYDGSYHHKTTGTAIPWPAVINQQTPQTIDDLWHATVNGRGQFFSANDPQQLAASLTDIMKAIVEITDRSSSSVALNGDWLFGKLGPDTLLYQATFSNKDEEWTGNLKAYELDPVTGSVLDGSVKWSAAQQLAGKAWDERVIATYNGGGVAFAEPSLSAGQKAQLGPKPAEMIKYLRGLEIQDYRQRTSKLGDIVNSKPVFIDEMLYIGGNDGMLHAFDADTGEERFAYVPNLVFSNLKELADPAYEHRFFVDLTPTVKKAVGIFGGANIDILLVGGLRGGGKGYFAIDVSDAKNIVSESGLAARVKWEYPVATDDDMGFSYSAPVIVKSNSPSHPWVVIVGNGYNSANGSAVLYILDAAYGTVIRKIDTRALPASDGTLNGLSSPIAIDLNYDQKTDFVYAGDLQGNLWKFDLRATSPSSWSVAFGSASDPKPLFQARGPGGGTQPITTRPDVMYHPSAHGLMVCFGTGKFLGGSDAGDTDVQTIYGIWDYGDTVYDLASDSWSTDDNTEYLGSFDRSSATLSNQPVSVGLLEQTFQDYEGTFNGSPTNFRVFSENYPDWITMPDASGQEDDLSDSVANHAGYYIDLTPGERVVSGVLIRSGILTAIGYRPETDRCGPGGRSMFMELNAFTGGNLAVVQFDFNNDNAFSDEDKIDIDSDPGSTVLRVPSGLMLPGRAQMPAYLILDKDRERLYFSGAGGGPNDDGDGNDDDGNNDDDDDDGDADIAELEQRAPKLGVTYWMQLFE